MLLPHKKHVERLVKKKTSPVAPTNDRRKRLLSAGFVDCLHTNHHGIGTEHEHWKGLKPHILYLSRSGLKCFWYSYRGSTAVELIVCFWATEMSIPQKKLGKVQAHKTFFWKSTVSGFLHLPVKKRELIENSRKKLKDPSDGSLNESDETFLLKPQVPKFFHMRNPRGKVQQTNTDPKGTINIQRCYWCSTVQAKSLPVWRASWSARKTHWNAWCFMGWSLTWRFYMVYSGSKGAWGHPKDFK